MRPAAGPPRPPDPPRPPVYPSSPPYPDPPGLPREPAGTRAAGRWRKNVARNIENAGVSRVLRRIIGVKEDLLDLVPTERARYTSLGALVVGTASVGTVSMWVALSQVSDAGWVLAIALLLPALGWGMFVLVMDRALITSASGSSWWTRIPALLVRFALAAVLGLVIAEPLVLQLFDTAIKQEISDRRDAEADALRDRLFRCNPIPGTPVDEPPASGPPIDCTGALIDVGQALGGTAGQLASLRADEAALQQQIQTEAAEQSRLDELARKECTGEAGEGLSGQRGVGSLCQQARKVADEYTAAHPASPLTERLESVRDQVTQLGGDVAGRSDEYETARNEVIAQRVQDLIDNQGGIGLLERFASLDRLTSSQDALWLREWFIRLVLVLVDCLPVLVKFLGGATSYDKIVDRELTSGRSVHKTLSEVGEDTIVSRLRADQQIRRDRVDADIRKSLADVLANEDREIDERRQRYLSNAGRPDWDHTARHQNGARNGRGRHQGTSHGGGGSINPGNGDSGVGRGEEPMGASSRTR
ncbi:MAG: DUF4407 domain-containing protein [Pseudonocardia sp.]